LVVSGAIQGARDLGLDVAKAASAAANGAIKGAGDISLTAVDQVTRAVTGVIDGVNVVVAAEKSVRDQHTQSDWRTRGIYSREWDGSPGV
jgi:hypothetical protein